MVVRVNISTRRNNKIFCQVRVKLNGSLQELFSSNHSTPLIRHGYGQRQKITRPKTAWWNKFVTRGISKRERQFSSRR
jgi:hypothetical protein